MNFLDFIPGPVVEIFGTILGLIASVFVFFQVVEEYRDPHPSTLTLTYIIGWAAVFFCWMLYGIRMRAIAVGVSNVVLTLLQLALLYCVLRKRHRPMPEHRQKELDHKKSLRKRK